ncbi:MAG TPA: ArsR family transcriptional regulator, partial [Candidatus Bathyarchaeota archaeon]|nr:ArsR family transcriptional regulator [Candidatus Bathyarchaeota archaeon]
MKDFMVIKDPKVAKLFADPVRRGILHNLRRRPMSPCQLARALGKNVSSITYHLNTLEKAGLVEQCEVRIRGNIIERYYRATAKMFVISYTLSEGLVPGSEDIAKWSREICKRAANSLRAFGYHVPNENVKEWTDLIERFTTLEKKAYEHVISKQVSPINAG